MKKTLVLGLGKSGLAAAFSLKQQGVPFFGVDKKISEASFPCQNEDAPVDFHAIDRIILSPGITPRHPILLEAKKYPIEIIGEAEFGFQKINQPVLAVTGTNGKTTVTLMVAHVLNCVGKKAEAFGNIGHPLSFVSDCEIVVAELSSFQLETLQQKKIDAAVILNITPDHLDRHETMEAYAKAKIRIQECLKPGGKLFVEMNVYQNYGHLFNDRPTILESSHRTHDALNQLAAFSLCQEFGVTRQEFDKALSIFKPPSHRIQFVREHCGVKYFNDSKGTNVDATIAAVLAMEGPVYLIAGGVDKQSSYAPWIKVFEQKVKMVFTIGEAASKIEADLRGKIAVSHKGTLQEAVLAASKLGKKGGNVLLSPGCSSFDQFKDYVDRGNQFMTLVRELA